VQIICGVFLCPLALALSILLGWHVYLIFHNKTTIEVWEIESPWCLGIYCLWNCNVEYVGRLQYHEGVRAMWLAEKAGNLYHHPYDLGVYENLVSVSIIPVLFFSYAQGISICLCRNLFSKPSLCSCLGFVFVHSKICDVHKLMLDLLFHYSW
jgi:hypothetical protein